MIVTLINKSDQKALTTVARLKVYLGIGSDNQDQLLTLLINEATGFIEQYTRRHFLSQTYTNEKYDGTGTRCLVLKNFPVSSITSIEQNLDPDNSSGNWEAIATKDYFLYEDGRVEAYSFTFDKFLAYPQKYRVTYVAGYKIDFNNENDTTLHTLPMEIEMVAMRLCAALWNQRRAEGLSNTRIGDLGVSLKATIFDDQDIKAMLDKYAAPSFN